MSGYANRFSMDAVRLFWDGVALVLLPVFAGDAVPEEPYGVHRKAIGVPAH